MPHRRVHGLGCREARHPQARQGDDRAHQRQHRHRARLRRRRARLSGDADDAGDHVDRAPQGAEGLRREAHSDRRRTGHERFDRKGGSRCALPIPTVTCCCSSSRIPPIPKSTSRPPAPKSGTIPRAPIDVLVAGIGTGGTITGVSRYIKQVEEKKILSVAVEPTASAVITQTLNGEELQPGPHKIQGIGAGFIPGHARSARWSIASNRSATKKPSRWPAGCPPRKEFFPAFPAAPPWPRPLRVAREPEMEGQDDCRRSAGFGRAVSEYGAL